MLRDYHSHPNHRQPGSARSAASEESGSVKRKSLAHSPCPVARSLDAIGEWWSLLIVRDALMGKRRFGEFQQSLGAARNILAARLKKLVACGILEQVPAAGPARTNTS